MKKITCTSTLIQGGSNMTGTNCDLFTHNQSRSYLNHLAACMGERRGAYRVLVGKPEGRRPLDDPGIDERIILKWMLGKRDGGITDYINLAQDRDRWRVIV
jgi:hypothetical protein